VSTPFDEWANHPDPGELWAASNGFSIIYIVNLPELERFMEKYQTVLFYSETAE
jgi:hypothetical protein